MKWLPKDKRNPFIAIVVGTVAVMALVYFFLISSQYDSLSKIAMDRKADETRLRTIENTIKDKNALMLQRADVMQTLSRAEQDMASGDLYSWSISTISLFKSQYKVEIPEIGHPTVGNVDLLPGFPYKQLRFTLNGTAYYHDLGKFIADFENAFPHARIINLVIEPIQGDGEKLSFRMDIAALIKNNPS